jgi:tetratricopeptide (TPR) repeat protein
MNLSMWFLIAFLFLPGTPVQTGQRANTTDEKRRDEIATHSSRSTAASQARDFDKAEEEWRKVLTLDPQSAQALNNLGMVLYLEHKYPQAEATLREALHAVPSLMNAQVLLGATLEKEGKIQEAVAQLEQALKSRLSESAERTARVALHEALFASKDYPHALEVLQPLAKRYPRDVDILYSLGQTYLRLATQTFEQIATVSPQSYRVHQILGDALGQQGRYHEAIQEYRLALAQKPDLSEAHYQIGLLYRTYENSSEGDNEALREFESELKINPYDAWSEYRLGRIYIRQERAEDAISHLRRAVQLDETIVPARLVLARALEGRGAIDAAKNQLEAAAKLDPGNATVHYRLANLLKKTGDLKASEQEMKRFEAIQAEQTVHQQDLEKAIRHSIEPENKEPLEKVEPPVPNN